MKRRDANTGLAGLQARWPGIEIGSYPFFEGGRFGVSVVLRGAEAGPLDHAADELRALIRDLGAEPTDGA